MTAQPIHRLHPPSPQVKTVSAAERGEQNQPSHKPIPSRFRLWGGDYRQIAREGNAAIYEQTKPGCPDLCAFEVIRIRRRDGFSIAWKWIEAAEVYPTSESWGADGFTCAGREAAFRKSKELLQ